MGRRLVALWLVGVMSLLAIPGCGGPVRYARAVDESPGQFLRLEARYGHSREFTPDSASLPFTHPLSLTEEGWEKIIKTIRIQLRKGLLTIGSTDTRPEEAFTEGERRYLTKHLTEAFSKARPDEWVVFYLSHPRDQGENPRGGPGVTEVTSGGFYAEGPQFHFVLANYRYAVSMPLVLDQIRDDPLWPAGEAFYELVPGAYQTLRRLDSFKTKLDLTKPLRANLSDMAIEYKSVLALPDKPVLGPDAQPPLEERLRLLQRLREQGLITEDEYRIKRQRLLENL